MMTMHHILFIDGSFFTIKRIIEWSHARDDAGFKTTKDLSHALSCTEIVTVISFYLLLFSDMHSVVEFPVLLVDLFKWEC